MAIAPTFQRYLDQHVAYDVIAHEPTMSSMQTAQACHISGDCLAKAVVLGDDSGYMLAVLPATHHIRMHDVRLQFGKDVDLASEGEIKELFQDCVLGAVRLSANATASTPSSTTLFTNRATYISRRGTTRRSFISRRSSSRS